MGNTRTIQMLEVSKPLNPQFWKKYKFLSHCQILKNIHTQQEAELYVVTLKGDLLQQYEKYQFRRKQESNLVGVLSVTRLNLEYLCIPQQKLQVITERIPYLLSDLQGLTLSESLYVIYQSLIGFKLIYQNMGYIFIHADLIGFNLRGQVKVWLNQNFASNYPEKINERFAKDNKKLLRKRMIDQLFMIVEQHSLNKKFTPKFHKLIIQEDICDFLDAINIIKDFLIEEEISLPNRLIIDSKNIKKSKKNHILLNQKQQKQKIIIHNSQTNLIKNPKSQLLKLFNNPVKEEPSKNKLNNQSLKINHSFSEFKQQNMNGFLNKTTIVNNDSKNNLNKNKNISFSFIQKKNPSIQKIIFTNKIIPLVVEKKADSVVSPMMSLNTSSHDHITNKTRVEIKMSNSSNEKLLNNRQPMIQRRRIQNQNVHKSLIPNFNSTIVYRLVQPNRSVERFIHIKNMNPQVKFKMPQTKVNNNIFDIKNSYISEQNIKYKSIVSESIPQNQHNQNSLKNNQFASNQIIRDASLETSQAEKKQIKSSLVIQNDRKINNMECQKEPTIQDYLSNLLSYQDLRIKLLQSLDSPKQK